VTELLHPDGHATANPEQPAYIMAGSGQTISYGQLTDRSRQGARLMRELGAERGDCIAITMENNASFLELAWAAQRAGLRYTTISPRLTAEEALYIIGDSSSRLLFASTATAAVAREVLERGSGLAAALMVDGAIAGFQAYQTLRDTQPTTPVADEAEGVEFLYSSGTTGRPKAIASELPLDPIGTSPAIVPLFQQLYGFDKNTVYLSPAPLYHSAPLRFTMAVHRLGGTAVVMERFEPEWFLELIERHRITHVQMVPTMFVRLLRLPEVERRHYDLSSLKVVIHAAAPCPREVKQQMLEWLGPIVYEYYSSTEIYMFTAIDPNDWLAHPGSVGRSLLGTPHILDDDGREVAAGEIGTVWSEGGPQFSYHNAPEKTAESRNVGNWTTVGDIGYLDEDGYLFLTDRKADMIISGGVNIYPQESENVLVTHPSVADAAVFGVPHDELGEDVKGVVELVSGVTPSPELESELLAFCYERLAKYKCPRSIDFTDELPRHATGKLYKRVLRDRYAELARPEGDRSR
jgi:long-chain acyl-CoA synthetase